MCRIHFLFATCFSLVTSICAQLVISESHALRPDTLLGMLYSFTMKVQQAGKLYGLLFPVQQV